MDYGSILYLNSFSIGSLLPTLFFLMMAIFLFSTKQRSKATLHMAIAFSLFAVFNFAYVVCASIYHPAAAYHRWATVITILLLQTHYNMFYFYYPTESRPVLAKIYLTAGYLIAISASVLFIMKTANAEKVYLFNAHYWDFKADSISKIIGLIIVLNVLINFIFSIVRTITTKGRDRWVVLFMGITFLFATLVPSVANTLSRDGSLDRNVFHTTWVIFNLLGFGLYTGIYFNNTRDRISFQGKLIGISLITIMLILQFLSHFSLLDNDRSFDSIHIKDVALIHSSGYRPDSLEYIKEYRLDENALVPIYGGDGYVNTSENSAYRNSLLAAKCRELYKEGNSSRLNSLLDESDAGFSIYALTIMHLLSDKSSSRENMLNFDQLLTRISALNSRVAGQIDKAAAPISVSGAEALFKSAAKKDKTINVIYTAFLGNIKEKNIEGEQLKSYMLTALTPLYLKDTRLYRHFAGMNKNCVSYLTYDRDKNSLIETGFSYLSYREYMHSPVLKIVIMLIIVILIVRYGFVFFFSGIIINSLKRLAQGVRQVNAGDLDVSVPVKIEDEIGYITHSFNNMVVSIKDAKTQLQDYADNLEHMVRERTSELKSARDALWGEMELAKKIQTVLVPLKPRIQGYSISAYMKPADEVGGDYYDVINAGNRNWLVIGDVSGHGVPAGLIMMMVQTAIHLAVIQKPDANPAGLLTQINQVISSNIKRLNENKYMTITVLTCFEGGNFFYSGLHQDILVYRSGSGQVETIETEGMWIGVVDDISNMINDRKFQLYKDDIAVLFTDGLTEAVDADGSMYSNERLERIIKENGHRDTEDIKKLLLDSLEGYKANDDITFVLIRKMD